MNRISFQINKQFKDKLITGILSCPIIYIPHFHYAYIDEALKEILTPKENGDTLIGFDLKSFREYSVSGDALFFESKKIDSKSNIKAILKEIIDKKEKDDEGNNVPFIYLIKNVSEILTDKEIQYYLQTIASLYERGQYVRGFTIILVSPNATESLPPEIEKFLYVVEIPNPTEKEIADYLAQIPASAYFEDEASELRIELTRTLQGLQHYEIEQIIQSITVRTGGTLTEKSIRYALEEKKSIVKKSGIIEVVDTDISFDDVGGLENLRTDLEQKAILFKHLNEIKSSGLPTPKGVLILGMPGCGKSLIAKSIANKFGVSLLRLDVNRLMGQYVGQSESNLRRALATAEAAHPCVLWIDEIEKAFAGANGGGSGSNNDIVMRLMGHFLTWMQERKTAVYIVATANDVMRPEFMRKGRFDEVYFVDFPKEGERFDILKKKLSKYKKTQVQQEIYNMDSLSDDVIKEIAKSMAGKDGQKEDIYGFSGSEIESVVNSVIEKKFIEYLTNFEKSKQKVAVKVTKDDFFSEIKKIKDSVMSNQEGKKDEFGKKEKTSVERIRDLQAVYKFREASKNNK